MNRADQRPRFAPKPEPTMMDAVRGIAFMLLVLAGIISLKSL